MHSYMKRIRTLYVLDIIIAIVLMTIVMTGFCGQHINIYINI